MAFGTARTKGRPRPELVEELAAAGKGGKEAARALGIGIGAFRGLLGADEELREAWARGRERAVDEVERALWRRALGYYYYETEVVKYPNGAELRRKRRRHVMPDVAAQVFLLKNRRPQEWRDMTERVARVSHLVELEGASLPRLREALERVLAVEGEVKALPAGGEGRADAVSEQGSGEGLLGEGAAGGVAPGDGA